jgi:hypothetical protein
MKPHPTLLEVLGLTEADLQALWDHPDDGAPDETSNWLNPRHRYHLHTGVVLRYLERDVPDAIALVAPRNISMGGTALLHRGHLSGGTPVHLEFPLANGRTSSTQGRVVRSFGCLKDVYEIGVLFDESIDIVPILGNAWQQEAMAWLKDHDAAPADAHNRGHGALADFAGSANSR